ncbi:MAG: zinc-binding dehydrogenase [Alphaproteobacteria bacterium]|uniref:Zinc-binding dehydrogenase n=1 Tax=Candidatus Nitrobium versatile TaxID=2884831 RepID=A0A953M0V0_9BACT|nr:zinc-binding dehydrogenase [Candidatus Nitrobium versatile]
MKVAKLYRFNDIRIENVPVPSVGPRDALVRTRACGICSGDVMPWYIEKKAPLVIGHEPVGEIVALGREADTPLRPGDRVFVHHHAPCLHCRSCARGDHVQCVTWRKTKIEPGGLSEYILVPGINLLNDTLRLPDTLGYEEGTLVEPAACVVKSLRRSSMREGDTLLIIGLGVMGQMHVLLAREFGARTVIGADRVPFRLNKALELGADHVIDVSAEDLNGRVREMTGGAMADIVIVGPNSVEAMEQGIRTVAPGGTVVFFTPAKPGEILSADPNYLYFRDINLVTSYSCGPDDTRKALEYIGRGIISAEKIVTHRFPLTGAGEAYRLTAEAKDSLKCLIIFDGV